MGTTTDPPSVFYAESLKAKVLTRPATLAVRPAEIDGLRHRYDEAIETACQAGCDFSAVELLDTVLRERERRGYKPGLLS